MNNNKRKIHEWILDVQEVTQYVYLNLHKGHARTSSLIDEELGRMRFQLYLLLLSVLNHLLLLSQQVMP